jgi:hypothetical protein
VAAQLADPQEELSCMSVSDHILKLHSFPHDLEASFAQDVKEHLKWSSYFGSWQG